MKKTTGRPSGKKPTDRTPKSAKDGATPDTPPPQDATSWVSAITTALNDFDFGRCAELYKLMDWTWNFGSGFRVPDEGDIRDEVGRMIKDAIAGAVACAEPETSYFCATGGLHVRAWKCANPEDNFICIGFVPVDNMA